MQNEETKANKLEITWRNLGFQEGIHSFLKDLGVSPNEGQMSQFSATLRAHQKPPSDLCGFLVTSLV